MDTNKINTYKRGVLGQKIPLLSVVVIGILLLFINFSRPTFQISPCDHHQEAEKDTSSEYRLLKYFLKYRYIPPATKFEWVSPYLRGTECGEGPDFEPWFSQGVEQRSRLEEDRIIYESFFKGKDIKNGTYIELGGYDGRTESNSHFFEKCLGWKGLLIEGNPENYHKLVTNRRYAHKMSFAPSCDAAYEAENKTVEFYWYPMTNVGLLGSATTYEGKQTVSVPCGPLSPVVEDIFQEGEHINFFSLDVEGAEMMVLNTINFKKVNIDILMIEVENQNCKKNVDCVVRNQVRAKMEEEGYVRYEDFVHASDVYVHPNSPFQMPE